MKDIALIGGVGLDALHFGFFAAFVVAVGVAVWLRAERRTERAADLARLDAALSQVARLEVERSNADEDVQTQRQRAEEAEKKLAALSAVQGELEAKFADLAQGALRNANAQFLQLANQTFEKHQVGASGRLEKLISPINESFTEFRKRVDAIEKVRVEERTALQEQVKAIGESLVQNTRATGKLVTALSAPKGAGSWGEESLRNVMELAGMSEHADFVEQTTDDTNRGKLRPDVVIRMPGGREIVVDSKVSMDDYLKAADEADTAVRDAHLAAHARKLRDHVQRLARKEYWKDFDGRVDFVAMYVPGEQFYSAAVEIDRDLFDYAARNKVIIVTPSTLIALAKAVAYGWRQEEAAANARQAAELGRQLYDSLIAMGGHVERTGKSLTGAVENYNKMVGSLERNVLSKARKFEDLRIAQAGAKPVAALDGVQEPVRLPSRTGELAFEAPDDEAA